MNTSPRASTHGDVVVFTHGELGLPDELWRTGRNANCARLTHTIPNDFSSRAWLLPEKLALRHADGTDVRSHVYLPRATSLAHPDRARACVVFIHGAGYLQNVTDSMTEYAVNLMFHSRLARSGYVVVDVDYRGSQGYGSAFRTDVQYALGELELDDIRLVLDALAERGVVDPARVACYGGSYGGFLVLMALFTAPERWVGGAALRSVTDWRTYHPRYTQPRLGRPSTHAEAYARSSPIDLAEGLEDPLLLLHGMVDSNVFAQDTIRLMEELIDLGKDFEAMLYPSQGHDFEDGRHWLDEYRRIERFLTRHLGPP
jgi:dipeptidyl aminopeptidase/acylaminoacyl peptidase